MVLASRQSMAAGATCLDLHASIPRQLLTFHQLQLSYVSFTGTRFVPAYLMTAGRSGVSWVSISIDQRGAAGSVALKEATPPKFSQSPALFLNRTPAVADSLGHRGAKTYIRPHVDLIFPLATTGGAPSISHPGPATGFCHDIAVHR